mmetsp:Transcript_26568/g.54504  ORF Transcript_26568/g.54504 Transcript_26568/m.54504 type:complete len:167 (+) Transcript_26568:287-787(+)
MIKASSWTFSSDQNSPISLIILFKCFRTTYAHGKTEIFSHRFGPARGFSFVRDWLQFTSNPVSLEHTRCFPRSSFTFLGDTRRRPPRLCTEKSWQHNQATRKCGSPKYSDGDEYSHGSLMQIKAQSDDNSETTNHSNVGESKHQLLVIMILHLNVPSLESWICNKE